MEETKQVEQAEGQPVIELPYSTSSAYGYLSELRCIEALYRTGHHVAVPPVLSCYDLVASRDGERWSKIQIKTITPHGHARLTRGGGETYKIGAVDEFMIVDQATGNIWRLSSSQSAVAHIDKYPPWVSGGQLGVTARRDRPARAVAETGVWNQLRALLMEHAPKERPEWMAVDLWGMLMELKDGRTVREIAYAVGIDERQAKKEIEVAARKVVAAAMVGAVQGG